MSERRPKHRTIKADELRAANDNAGGEAEAVAFGRAILERLRSGEAVEIPAEPPTGHRAPGGVLLAACRRGDAEELRVTREVFVTAEGEHRPFVSVRVWRLDGRAWRPTRRGVSVRMSELAAVAGALGLAREAHEGDR